jgi:DNA replication protein
MNQRPTDDLIRIANSGGGMILNASTMMTSDLIRIANAASGSGARITIAEIGTRPTGDLIRIANAGKGCVAFA